MVEVYELLKQIPSGKVTTYGILGKKLGVHPRVVGMLMNKNPNLVKVPCHRVVSFDGKIGGYVNGMEEKQKLLEKEGIKVSDGKILGFEKVLHNF